jgi:DNA mismatch endonuclease, patch repair protein
MDKFSPKDRSRIMSSVRSRDTKPEIVVRRFLFSLGFRYSLHSKRLPGSPDVTLNKFKIAIFINGCFWHGHPRCKYSMLPVTHHDFWKNKIALNRRRDKQTYQRLRANDWQIIKIWTCSLKSRQRIAVCLQRLRKRIHGIIDKQRRRSSSAPALKTNTKMGAARKRQQKRGGGGRT